MDNKQDIKPRLICCPNFTIRSRIGMISYFTLKWCKKKFPEFFLARSPDDILEEFRFLETHPHTYESDFSAYDSTNNFFLR